jgi:Ca2+-transporting ATPase
MSFRETMDRGHAEAPWSATAEDLLKLAGADPARGLSAADAAERARRAGPNQLISRAGPGPLRLLWGQATSPMVLVLWAAGAAAWSLKGPRDAIAIIAVIVLNVALGFFQEYKAERALAALRRLAAPRVRVRREGRLEEVDAADLVPGDIAVLEAGNAVPADGRLIEAAHLLVQEASLTGESLPVEKTTATLPAELPLGDRRNMVFAGTAVAQGRGLFLVTATGMDTELGRIAHLLQAVSSDATPLQRRLKNLGLAMGAAVALVIALAAALGTLRGEPLREVLMTGVAVAVAAIPEGLPAVMTITLALGAQRMMKRRALIRRLPAVETLGSVTVICSDKTGTLTENRMRVRVLDVAGHTEDITEPLVGEHPTLRPEDEPRAVGSPALSLLLTGGALANDAVLRREDGGAWTALGDPTEGALLIAAARYGLPKERLDADFPREAEVPFTSERKRMSTVHRRVGGSGGPWGSRFLVTKGGVDVLLPLCDRVWIDGPTPWTEDLRRRVNGTAERLAAQGLRVLGVATRNVAEQETVDERSERGLVFVGFLGLMDPPRPEAKEAVALCRQAGIRPVMITGDHPLTAVQVARELGIVNSERDGVLTGADLDRLDAAGLDAAVVRAAVFARVAPEHKLAIVSALQKRGDVVAMTGDGVNDAPALRRADIGVAMGITGTDVAKEAADMVITDDNFGTIVTAVAEGRTIYDNIRRFVKYIVSSNSGEVATLFIAQLAGMPMPLNTLQILWMNLVTDGLPGLALGLEKAERDAMRRPPHAPAESLFSRGAGRHVMIMGSVLAASALAVGLWAWRSENPAWGSMVFTTLTLGQLGQALALRSDIDSIFFIGLTGNRLLLGAVAATLAAHFVLLYWAPAQGVFGTMPLSASDLALCLAAATSVFWAAEAEKLILRRQRKRS